MKTLQFINFFTQFLINRNLVKKKNVLSIKIKFLLDK